MLGNASTARLVDAANLTIDVHADGEPAEGQLVLGRRGVDEDVLVGEAESERERQVGQT